MPNPERKSKKNVHIITFILDYSRKDSRLTFYNFTPFELFQAMSIFVDTNICQASTFPKS